MVPSADRDPAQSGSCLSCPRSEGTAKAVCHWRIWAWPPSTGPSARSTYVHALFRRILETEGFSRFRYKCAIGLAACPDNPLAVAERTNREAFQSAGLLASVPNKPLIALATKNHLVLGLQALRAGTVKWDDAPTAVMSAPPREGHRHQELHETLADGIFVEVLDAAAWHEPPFALQALMERHVSR